jgi:hypothetical protein
LSNINESATIPILQKILEINKAQDDQDNDSTKDLA